ncbi:toxin-activating lysine-acyltransferase [Roseovarius salinarum]|uniref:toxin-activating lysine-acyltransferase n=1 Tax=Roseovarius salinarum TaxID=1981892 RepID=UPI0012FFF51E|nr:toxin-activating lysine-acyltransferase [Roseovarius salinarum]
MRHLAALRDAGPSSTSNDIPFPDGWFDLPQDTLADLGAMMYLAALSRFNRTRTLPQALAQIEPPLRLSQYKLFRSNGFPRAFVTWAGLTHDAEYRLAIDHQPLQPQDWNSGASKWLIDLVAPFGHVEQVLTRLAANPEETRVRALWHNRAGTRYRIVEWTRADPGGEIAVGSYGVGQFRRRLAEG